VGSLPEGVRMFHVTGAAELARLLNTAAQNYLPRAIARAENLTAWNVRAKVMEVMPNRLNAPTPTALKGMFVEGGTVAFKNDWGRGVPADQFLQPQVFGGPRQHKKFERVLIRRGIMRASQYAVPTANARLDRHGNIRGPLMVQILSGLRAFSEVGFNMNASNSTRSRARGHAQRYFASALGVWERRSRESVLILAFVDSAPRYRKRLPFFQVAERVAASRFPVNLRRAWHEFYERSR
jgi:hypothetical protein